MSDTRTQERLAKYTVLARYGAMRSIGTFATTLKKLRFGDKCILRSPRGTEWAEIASEPVKIETEPPPPTEGAILRRATPADYARLHDIEEVEQPKQFEFCANCIRERHLAMRLASVEHIFGGEKTIFYFLAEGRVDFRQLVKDLATQYRTRIEMRQIGVRDEARLLAEYEHCGRELCCRTFIKDLEPVTMRMAKLQKTTLDPTKISGRCGRLMCCLRFEDETYADLKSALPKKGTRVRLKDGEAEVLSSEILAQTLMVELPDRRFVRVPLSDVLEILPRDDTKSRNRGGGQKPKAERPRKQDARPANKPAPAAQTADAGGRTPQPSSDTPADPNAKRGRRRGRRRRGGRNRSNSENRDRQNPNADNRGPKSDGPAAPQQGDGSKREDRNKPKPPASPSQDRPPSTPPSNQKNGDQ